MKFIHKIGVELEGAFHKKHGSRVDSEDLDFCAPIEENIINKHGLYVGEVRSAPYSDRRKLKSWIKKFYPVLANSTCGYHIHVSLKKEQHHEVLICKEFHKFFLDNLENWVRGKRISKVLRKRLFNGNSYCYREYDTYCRYRAVNFTNINTIEFRIFSQCMPANLAQKCIDFVHEVVEKFIQQQLDYGRIE